MQEAGFSRDESGMFADASGRWFRLDFLFTAGTQNEQTQAILTDAWRRGQAMTLDAAIDFALVPRAGVGRAVSAEAGSGASQLTPREREVVTLLASGVSNRRLADKLVITEGTAKLHVKHILKKLGLRSRSEVAAFLARTLNREP